MSVSQPDPMNGAYLIWCMRKGDVSSVELVPEGGPDQHLAECGYEHRVWREVST